MLSLRNFTRRYPRFLKSSCLCSNYSSSTFKTAVETAEKLVSSTTTKFEDPFSIVSHEMSNLAKSIASLIGSGHPVLNRVSSYYFEAEGKNVRPLIVLILSKALLKIPIEQRNRIQIDTFDVVDQSKFKGTPTTENSTIAGKSVDDSLSPLAILHGINPKVILDPLSKPMDRLPILDENTTGILPKQRRLAEIVEMIHTASLLHDDVIDLSDSRRGRPSGNIAFTNKMAVLAGDFLLGRASVAIARLRNPEVIELLSTTIANLVEGEFMQLKNTVIQNNNEDQIINDGDIKEIPRPTGKVPTQLHDYTVRTVDHETNVDAAFEYYLHKTYLKTASLMSKSCRAAAVLSGAQDDIIENCYNFGRNLGLCFQIVDDMLDYTSSDLAIGKPSQADLKLGLATAPILYAWKEEPELGELIGRKFSQPGDVEIARRAVDKYNGVEKTREMATMYCHEALNNLRCLPESEARSALELLTNSVLTRTK